MEKGKADIVLEIPAGFERALVRESAQTVFVSVNAINGVKAGLGSAYLSAVISTVNEDIRGE